MIRWNSKIPIEDQKKLNFLMKMAGEPDVIKEYWAEDLKTGNKFIILRLRRALK